jgi:O-antigen ligase
MSRSESLRTSGRRIRLTSTQAIVLAFMLVLVVLGGLSAYQPRVSLLLAAGLPLGLGLFIWPEVTLGLYVNAGLFKADPRLSSLSSLIDFTLVLGAVLGAVVVYRLVLRRERIFWNREMSLSLAFVSVILVGLTYTPAGSYGTDKALRFVLLTMLAFFTPTVVIRSYQSVWLFFCGWLGFATLLAAEALGQIGTGQRLSAFNATTISMSRTVGVAIIILLFAVLMGQVSRHWQILAAVGLVFMMLVLVGSGSRGPLLMLVATVIFTIGVSIVKPGRRLRSLLVIGVLGITALGVFSSGLIPAASLQRFDLLIKQADADTSSQARLMVMRVAWYLFTTSPVVGRGTGSVSAFGAGREQVYPHNILLELAAENGLLGLSLYLCLVGMVLWRLISKLGGELDHRSLWLTLSALLLFALLGSMVSGDLNDNRDLWLFAGIALAATELERRMSP